jgi:transcription elongation factor Elf1
MVLLNITYQGSGSDFVANFECEHCHHKIEAWGYIDNNFEENVIPNAICPICGKSSKGETKEMQIKRLNRTYELKKA